MKKIKFNAIIYTAVFLFAGIFIYVMCSQSNQAISSIPLSLEFIGEYSFNDGEWKTLSKDTDLSSFDGDLTIRGKFNEDLPGGVCIQSYLNHIGFRVCKDGEVIYESTIEQYPDMCGSEWASWSMPELNEDEVMEIHLNNPHCYGNPEAYNEFLDSIYMSGDFILKDYFEKQNQPYRMISTFIIVVSIAIIGMAVGFHLMHIDHGSLLLKLGIMSILTGAYIYLDTKDISMRSSLMVFNTCVRQICIMLAALVLGTCIAELLKEKKKKIAMITCYVLLCSDVVLMLFSFIGVVRIFDTGMYWAILQGIICLLQIILCIYEIVKGGKKHGLLLISAVLLQTMLVFEIINGYVGWLQSGLCIKIVFMVIFALQLIRGLWLVAKKHQTSIKAEKLKEELRNSRIVLAMSQIRTHFIFNVLNAISGMCAYDPKKADETLITFARYLRSNINIMDEDKPETFKASIDHLEDYIRLEQVRFGDKIKFIKILETEDFMIPPLILQPVVENSIKHGILPKREGGTVTLHTWMENDNYIIEISDDGVGFDTEKEPRKGSVGIKNVCFRLQYMVNGTMSVKSSPGEGTVITITIPCTESDGKEKVQKQ